MSSVIVIDPNREFNFNGQSYPLGHFDEFEKKQYLLNLSSGEYGQQSIPVPFETAPIQGPLINAQCPICISVTKTDWLQHARTWALLDVDNLANDYLIEWDCTNCRKYRITSNAINSLISQTLQVRNPFRDFLLHHMPIVNGSVKTVTIQNVTDYLLPRRDILVQTVLEAFKNNVLAVTRNSAYRLTTMDFAKEYHLSQDNVDAVLQKMESAGYLNFDRPSGMAAISKLGEWAINVPGNINPEEVGRATKARKRA